MQGIQTLPYEVRNSPLVPSGGIENFEKAADMLAGFGREGDTYLIHAAEGETVIPLEVLDANPRMKNMIFTQMKEMGLEPKQYIVGDKLNSINPVTGQAEFFFKKLFRKVKKIVKKIAPIVLPIVAPYLLPMMPVAFATGLGSLAGGLIAGQSVGDALKGAVISGGLAGLGNMAFRGETFMGGSFFGSTANPTGTLADVNWKDAFTNIQNPLSNVGMTAGDAADPEKSFWTGEPTDTSATGSASRASRSMASKQVPRTNINQPVKGFETSRVPTVTNPNPNLPDNRNWFERNIWNPADSAAGGVNSQDAFLEKYLSPSRASLQPNPVDIGKKVASMEQAYIQGGGTLTPDIKSAMYKTVTKAAEPGIISKYGPLAATAIGAGAASDALLGTNFVLGQDADGDGFDDVTGRKLYDADPGKYAFGRGFYGNNPYYQDDTFIPKGVRTQTVAGGGSIEGPGTPTSDSIPAMLSDGEFVMNARAVRGAGGGDRTEGARRMYAMMREFEGKA